MKPIRMSSLNGTSPQYAIRNSYTHSPALHPNLVLGSLQLLFWLLIHPSAWRNHVARLAPDLRPDFCLAELSWDQWRDPAVRRLLLQGYLAWPLLSGLVVLAGAGLWALSGGGSNIAYVLTFILALGLASSLTFGVASGVAPGITFGIASGVVVGVTFGVLVGQAFSVARAVAIGATLGMAGGVAGSLARRGPAYSLARRMGGMVVGSLISLVLLVMASSVVSSVSGDEASDLAAGVVFGLVGGLAAGWRTRSWRRGLVFGAAIGLVVIGVTIGSGATSSAVGGVIFGAASGGLAGGVFLGALLGVLFVLPHVLTERIAGSWAGTVAGALVSGGGWLALIIAGGAVSLWPTLPLGMAGVFLGLTLPWWQPAVLYPFQAAWNLALLRIDEQRSTPSPALAGEGWGEGSPSSAPAGEGWGEGSLLRWNSAFWDEHQRLPLRGLEEHLALVMERNPAEGQAALTYLATGYSQRWAAQAAQIELDARRLERCVDVPAISQVHRALAAGELEGPASALLRSFSRISQDVEAALRQESAYNQRLALSAVEDRLDGLLRELTRSSGRYPARFYPIAAHWRQSVAAFVSHLHQEADLRQEIDNPYIIGVPLTEQQEIFVGRSDVSARIEQLLLDRRRPPLLLYGQRRMGKTSLLNNIGRLLPSTLVPLFVDLQGPASQASDHAGLLYNIARSMADSARRQRGLGLPALPRQALTGDPFTRFDEWLDEVEAALGEHMALLALDEFEALDGAIARGRFDEEAVMGTLRHLIQHRPRFKVLLAGSHTLEELQRWSGYLINVQVVHIGYLKEEEARQLIERPVRDFALRYAPDACQRVMNLTRCHPFLVQLLCAEIVALKNEQDPSARRLTCLADVEAAVPEALRSGSFFFADIQHNQVDAAALALLRFLAAQGEGQALGREVLARECPAGVEQALELLARRELVEPAGGGYRFQVELVRRWFSQEV
ncbi:MAG: ATP-binding protein [Thermoflexales bacterium]|nr:ATP-binding protein [Thermoflexales bacterium]